jgi:hypothetical protein
LIRAADAALADHRSVVVISLAVKFHFRDRPGRR